MPSLQPSTLLRTDTLIDFLYVLGRTSLGNTTYWALLAFFFAEWIYIFWIKKYFSKEIYIFLIFCKKSFFSKQKKNQYIFFFHIKWSFSANNVYFAKNTNIFSKKKKIFFQLSFATNEQPYATLLIFIIGQITIWRACLCDAELN